MIVIVVIFFKMNERIFINHKKHRIIPFPIDEIGMWDYKLKKYFIFIFCFVCYLFQFWSKIRSDCLSVSSVILPSTRPITSGAGEKP